MIYAIIQTVDKKGRKSQCLQSFSGLSADEIKSGLPKVEGMEVALFDESHPYHNLIITASGGYEVVIKNGELVNVIDLPPPPQPELELERRKIHLLVGLPGSGKSTFVSRQDGLILRCDEWKVKNPNHSRDMSDWRQYVSAVLNKEWDVSDVWIDQPTLGIESFKRFMNGVKLFASDRVYLHVFFTPIEVVKERNAQRPTEKQHSDEFYAKHGENPLIAEVEVAEFANVIYVREEGI